MRFGATSIEQSFPRSLEEQVMTIESLASAIHAIRFRPFIIPMAEGSRFDGPHPDSIAFHPNGRTAVLDHLQNEGLGMIDLLISTSIKHAGGLARA
jgi:hypothetical protein